jgi:phenylalanyl-tRNA synthetase alpha chain
MFGTKLLRSSWGPFWARPLGLHKVPAGIGARFTHQAQHAYIEVNGIQYPTDEWTNVSSHVLNKVPRKLHHLSCHPVSIISKRIEYFWKSRVSSEFQHFSALPPIVTPKKNFDELLIPSTHPGRSKNDTYYLNKDTLLRTHTSAHQSEVLRQGARSFLISGDCYRKDEIDATHYPIFHQMEGVRTFELDELKSLVLTNTPMEFQSTNPVQRQHDPLHASVVVQDMKSHLEAMCRFLFGADSNLQLRWNDDYFPFTSPSFELEVYFQGKWMEVLGSGVIQQSIYDNSVGSASSPCMGWAFGIGLERIAMILFKIPDIRLFWNEDPRFLKQFVNLNAEDPTSIVEFQPFSNNSPCYKDIAFWIPENIDFHENMLFDVVRDIAGDLVEAVSVVDTYTNPQGKTSKCFRIVYRSMNRYVGDVSNRKVL